MTRPHLLALTSEQLSLVLAGANQIPQRWRSEFLQGIADELMPLPNIQIDDVARAVRIVVERLHCTPLDAA